MNTAGCRAREVAEATVWPSSKKSMVHIQVQVSLTLFSGRSQDTYEYQKVCLLRMVSPAIDSVNELTEAGRSEQEAVSMLPDGRKDLCIASYGSCRAADTRFCLLQDRTVAHKTESDWSALENR